MSDVCKYVGGNPYVRRRMGCGPEKETNVSANEIEFADGSGLEFSWLDDDGHEVPQAEVTTAEALEMYVTAIRRAGG